MTEAEFSSPSAPSAGSVKRVKLKQLLPACSHPSIHHSTQRAAQWEEGAFSWSFSTITTNNRTLSKDLGINGKPSARNFNLRICCYGIDLRAGLCQDCPIYSNVIKNSICLAAVNHNHYKAGRSFMCACFSVCKRKRKSRNTNTPDAVFRFLLTGKQKHTARSLSNVLTVDFAAESLGRSHTRPQIMGLNSQRPRFPLTSVLANT